MNPEQIKKQIMLFLIIANFIKRIAYIKYIHDKTNTIRNNNFEDNFEYYNDDSAYTDEVFLLMEQDFIISE